VQRIFRLPSERSFPAEQFYTPASCHCLYRYVRFAQ
jgi:hypothetical protein